MASKDKTSKTARVMNLLSKKPDSPVAEAAEAPAASAAPAPSAPPTPPIVTSMAPDMAVSAQIKSALEDALEAELPHQAAPAPQPEHAPARQAAPAPQPEPAPAPAPVQEEVSAPRPEPETAPATEAESKWSGQTFPSYPGYINVMQVLVEEKAPKYVEMFGLCSCKRCMEDVKALTLNHLPSKYVVVERGDLIPRLTVYEGKFSSDITAQLLQACKLVMERPHHGR